MDDLKRRAAPRHTELVRLLADQQESQAKQFKQNVCIISLLEDLVDIERNRSEHDVLTHAQWQDAKMKAARSSWIQVGIGLAALFVGMAAFYTGIVDVNKDSPIVQGLMGMFL